MVWGMIGRSSCGTTDHSSAGWPTTPASTAAPVCSFTAVADSDGSAWCIDRRAFESMAASDPASLVLLETIVLRSTCLSAAHALEALERSSSAD